MIKPLLKLTLEKPQQKEALDSIQVSSPPNSQRQVMKKSSVLMVKVAIQRRDQFKLEQVLLWLFPVGRRIVIEIHISIWCDLFNSEASPLNLTILDQRQITFINLLLSSRIWISKRKRVPSSMNRQTFLMSLSHFKQRKRRKADELKVSWNKAKFQHLSSELRRPMF